MKVLIAFTLGNIVGGLGDVFLSVAEGKVQDGGKRKI